MSRITDYILEPKVVYTEGGFLVRVKVQDDYKYKKYIVSENLHYKTVQGTSFTLTDASSTKQASITEIKGAGINDILGINNGTIEVNGITITINSGYITINGTATTSGNYKLTNGLERAGTVSTAWKNEECINNITDKTFYFKYISGSADTSGCALRLYSPNNMDQWYFQQYTQTKLYTNATQIGAEGKAGCIVMYTNSGKTFNNYTFKLAVTDNYNYVTGDNNIVVSNKNLFDYENTTVSNSYSTMGTKTDNGYQGGWAYYINLPRPILAGTYFVSFIVEEADNNATANMRFIGKGGSSGTILTQINCHSNYSASLTFSEDVYSLRVDNGKKAETTLIKNIQVEKRNTSNNLYPT